MNVVNGFEKCSVENMQASLRCKQYVLCITKKSILIEDGKNNESDSSPHKIRYNPS